MEERLKQIQETEMDGLIIDNEPADIRNIRHIDILIDLFIETEDYEVCQELVNIKKYLK